MKAIFGATGAQGDDDDMPAELPAELNVAIVLPDIPMPIASEVMMAIDATLNDHGYKAVARNTGGGYMISARRTDQTDAR